MQANENPWKLTWKGLAVDLVDPRPETISPADIAHSLAQQCRWGGHTRELYTVAQHCVHVAETAVLIAQTDGDYSTQEIEAIRLGAILHDAHEAYTGDIATPIKRMLGSALMALEERLDVAIGRRCGVQASWMHHEIVKTADRILMVTEARDLMPRFDGDWLPHEAPLLRRLTPWTSDKARVEFGRILGHVAAYMGAS